MLYNDLGTYFPLLTVKENCKSDYSIFFHISLWAFAVKGKTGWLS